MRFLLRETCELCPTCASVTPHAVPRVTPATCGSTGAIGSGLLLVTPGVATVAALVPLAASVLFLYRGRRNHRAIACERCRARVLAARSRRRLLPGSCTEVNFL